MKIKLIILLSALCISGCELVGPRVKVEPPRVRVDGVEVENSDARRKQKFCPPGQAKKGNC